MLEQCRCWEHQHTQAYVPVLGQAETPFCWQRFTQEHKKKPVKGTGARTQDAKQDSKCRLWHGRLSTVVLHTFCNHVLYLATTPGLLHVCRLVHMCCTACKARLHCARRLPYGASGTATLRTTQTRDVAGLSMRLLVHRSGYAKTLPSDNVNSNNVISHKTAQSSNDTACC